MKILLSLFLLLFLVATLLFEVDSYAMELQDEALSRAMVAFGLAKGLNAVISLIQGTELSFTPVGVGINFTVGEVLDPFNDMVERFSWIMLFATVSLGVQKLLLVLSAKMFLQLFFALSAFSLLSLIWIKKFQNRLLLHYMIKLFLLLLLLRFGAVLFAFSSELLYNGVLSQEYTEASAVVEKSQVELKKLESESRAAMGTQEEQSMWEKFNSNVTTLKNSLSISQRIDMLEKDIEEASVGMIHLITLFVVQSMLLPLIFLWLFVSIIKYIFQREFNEERLKILYN